MAIFSGKIIEATYTNEKKDTIEILYKEEKKIIPYYIEVNHQHPDFQDLIKEYSLDKIQNTTSNKIKIYNDNLKEANKIDLKKLTDELEYKANNFTNWYDFMFHFDEKNATHMNFLFELKLKMFDEKKVKVMSEDKKNLIRDSLNPLEIIKIVNKKNKIKND